MLCKELIQSNGTSKVVSTKGITMSADIKLDDRKPFVLSSLKATMDAGTAAQRQPYDTECDSEQKQADGDKLADLKTRFEIRTPPPASVSMTTPAERDKNHKRVIRSLRYL